MTGRRFDRLPKGRSAGSTTVGHVRRPLPHHLHVGPVPSGRVLPHRFGFEVGYRWPDEEPPQFASLQLDSSGFGVSTRDAARAVLDRELAPPDSPGFELCLYVDDVDAASEELRADGVERTGPPTNRPWGERSAYFEDPDGNPIQITAPID